MKITNYASGHPFWIEIDIHGHGLQWELAFLRTEDDERMIVFPISDHEEYWDAERFARYKQRIIAQPCDR